MRIKKGDTVKILSGDDKGKTGKVLKAFPRDNKIVVDGANVIKKHQRSRKEGQKGQVVERPMPMNASKAIRLEDVKK